MNITLQIFITAAYVALFLFVIGKWAFFSKAGISRSLLSGIFLLKIIAGTVLWSIYTYYYPKRNEADIFKFFDDSNILFGSLAHHPLQYFKMLTGISANDADVLPYYEKMNWWYSKIYHDQYNESRIMIRFNAFVRLFSLGIYHVHTVVICFISMIGSMSIYKLFKAHTNLAAFTALFIAFLIPSLLFWTSGVLKEGLVLCALGVFIYAFFSFTNKKNEEENAANLGGAEASGVSHPQCLSTLHPLTPLRMTSLIKSIALIVASLLILLFSKAYLLACLFPCLLSAWLTRNRSFKQSVAWYLGTNAAFFIVLFSLYRLSSKLDIVHILCYKRGEYIYLAEHTGVKNLLYNNYLGFHWYSIMAEAPKAFFTVIARPFLSDSFAPLNLLAAFENLFFIIWGVLVLLSLNRRSFTNKPLLLFCINYVLITYTLIGLTTPIAGTLIRYKIVAMPFFAAILALLYNKEQLQQRFPALTPFLNFITKLQSKIIG